MDDFLYAVDVTKRFPLHRGFFHQPFGHVHAVNGVSLSLQKGKILGLCGESGCGKSTLGRLLARLMPADSGQIWIAGEEYQTMSSKSLKALPTLVQLVFQDPYSSLNPRMTIWDNLRLPLQNGPLRLLPESAKERVEEALTLVGMGGSLLPSTLERYPHQFSGGQQQRICLARALSVRPQILILDEVLSALDLSIQAQVMQLLLSLRKQLHLTLVFISHDLSSLSYLCDEVAVMYLGQIVERGGVEDLFRHPRHPYTQALIGSLTKKGSEGLLVGEPSSNIELPSGCSFHPRCPKAQARCHHFSPIPKKIGPRRAYRCIL